MDPGTLTMRTAPADIAALARFILSDKCRSIGILTGAGVSVASGIPDFRSPGGMYDTLRPDLITASAMERAMMKEDPTYVVSWTIFRQNQFPYLEVRRPFILGTRQITWKATIAHRFMELLHTKTAKLTRIFTQNIDGLDYQCVSIPVDKIVAVHGSIGSVACEGCDEAMDTGVFCDQVATHIKDIYGQDPQAPPESKPILCPHCRQPLVKPTTVLFGRQLPATFFKSVQTDLPDMDLLIVAGTSLVVAPANMVIYNIGDDTIRVVVNQEPVGSELGINYGSLPSCGRDLFLQGDCDTVFLQLIRELGWLEDLRQYVDVLPYTLELESVEIVLGRLISSLGILTSSLL